MLNTHGDDEVSFHYIMHTEVPVCLRFGTTKYLLLDVYAEKYRVKLGQNFRAPGPVYSNMQENYRMGISYI
jgi:hypothetical protein